MRSQRLPEPGRGRNGVEVVVRQRRLIQLSCELGIVVALRSARCPIAPACEAALRIRHGGDRIRKPAPVAVPDRCARLPLQCIVVEIRRCDPIEIAQRFRTSIPRQRESQGECIAARRRLIEAAGAREGVEATHRQISIAAREAGPACKQCFVFDGRRRCSDQSLDLPLRLLQERCPLQQRGGALGRQERCDLAREAGVGFLQCHACALFDELGWQRILRAQPFERAFAIRQAARCQPTLRDQRREIGSAVELDARREALAFERIVCELVAVLFQELRPVAALRQAREPHAAQVAANGLVLIVGDEGLRALID